MNELEQAYLLESDPIKQSGFSGGAKRWYQERAPILEAIDSSGDFLDIGCANGYLLQCLRQWAKRQGIELIPFGLDISDKLVELAKKRLCEFNDNFFIADASNWQAPRQFDFVYTLLDCVVETEVRDYLQKVALSVKPGGRLIVGDYGSRSKNIHPRNPEFFLSQAGFAIAGTAYGGTPINARFSWVDL